MLDVLKYNAMMAEKKVTHGRATIFKIVRNVCFTEKVFAIIGEMGSMLVLFVSTICRDLNTYNLTILNKSEYPYKYWHFKISTFSMLKHHVI